MTQYKDKALPRNLILPGNALTHLAELPDSSVDCIITSPPYFALRDYGQPDQLGLEPNVDAWVSNLVAVGTELHRVLKPTGSFWLNLGDSYSHHPREGAPKKSLLMGPQRLALALVAQGWLLRNHVIWAKTNPMPSNVTDRLSCTHESVYFFTKQPRYFFDLNAIREPHKERRSHSRASDGNRRLRDERGGNRASEAGYTYPPVDVLPRRQDRSLQINDGLGRMKAAGILGHPLGKNTGDVWAMGTAAFHGNHFATFPTRLVERPLLATCPERTCANCGTPWLRAKQKLHGRMLRVGPLQPACGCNNAKGNWHPGIVLDPFIGSGTVALVAEQHQRDWLGIELNPTYAAMAMRRIETSRAEHGNHKEEQCG